jgi:glycosyltransferase 2 family protein
LRHAAGQAVGARLRQTLRWALAIVALSFVAWIVPVRDRCWDAQAPASTRVAVSRGERDGGCVLHLRTGEVHVGAAACAQLRCEPGVATAFASARPGIIVALVGLYALGTVAWAARWRALLGLAGVDLRLGQVWRLSIEAQAAGIVLPGGIGGDALRITSVAALPARSARGAGAAGRPPLAIVVASVMLDRAVGLSVVTALAAALATALGRGVGAGPVAGVMAVVPLAFVAGVTVLRRAPIERIAWMNRGRMGAAVAAVLEYLRHPLAPRAIAVAAALSVVVAGVQFATIRGLIFALGAAPTSEKWVYIGTAMAFVASALPTLPGAWGTADAAYVFFLGLAGLAPGTALAVCLLYRLFWYISGITGALLHLTRASQPSRAPGHTARSAAPEEPPA